MAGKEFRGDGMKAGSAIMVMFLLAKQWFGIGRKLVSDIYFAIMINAIKCQKRGLYCAGLVKTSLEMFSKKLCQASWDTCTAP